MKNEIEELKERITFPTKKLETKMIIEEKIQPKPAPRKIETKEAEEEDELEIPAFIRRQMEKEKNRTNWELIISLILVKIWWVESFDAFLWLFDGIFNISTDIHESKEK